MKKKKISIFGSTGSIGDSTLKLFNTNKKDYEIYTLSGFKNYKKIVYQIKKFKPKVFIVFDNHTYLKIKNKFKKKNVLILNSENYKKFRFKLSEIAIAAIPGIAGLKPTLDLINMSRKILIANKESVICGWDLIQKKAKKKRVNLIPIDSEHFSIFNLINQEKLSSIEKIYLTASGGPFLNLPISKIKKVKPIQAVSHPKWKMGKKISVDSATLMNKIFEVIEAHKLFSIDLKKIEILIHPQSLVHAIIKFNNGLYKFLYFEPDMKIPIGNAMFNDNFKVKTISKNSTNLKFSENLNFKKVDKLRFPAIKLKPILNKYISMPIVLNAANEIFVDQFLKKNISFYSIINYLMLLLKDQKMRKYAIKKPKNLKTILLIDNWARNKAMQIISKKN